tara:strand:- start:26 stop:400 length:375 start_codon:yes stop_codon:yes gene_type:complete
MTNIELLDIHLNNSDLTLGNLAQIHNSTIATVRAILSEYYAGKSWTSPILAQPDSETGGSLVKDEPWYKTDLPLEIEELQDSAKSYVIRLAQDGHISDWSEAWDALNECAAFRPDPNPDTYGFI